MLASLGFLWGLAVIAYAKALLSPPRMTDGKALYRLGRISPIDLDMPYEVMNFTLRQPGDVDLTLAGWWIPTPEPTPKTAVLLHGYADAKVGALAWAPLFRSLGYNLLLIDLRAHGESTGQHITGGVNEADDLGAVLDELKLRFPTRTEHLLLFGASLGGAGAALLATRRDDIAGLVLDSPTATFESGVLAHGRLLNLPGPLVSKPALRLAKYSTGIDFPLAAITRNIPQLKSPLLLILPTLDTFVSPAERETFHTLFENHKRSHSTSRLWEPDTHHLLAVATDPARYASEITALVKKENF